MNFRRFRFLVLFILAYAIYSVLVQLLLGKHHLIGIKGSLLKKESFVKSDILRTGEVEQEVYLSFILRETYRVFILKANIDGMKQGFNLFGGVDRELGYAGEITVMIEEAQFENGSPKVYAIYADGKNIFERKRKPANIVGFYIIEALLIFTFCIVLIVPKASYLQLNPLIFFQQKARPFKKQPG